MARPLWKVFDELVRLVRKDHQQKNALVGTGHDFTHALLVAQHCLQLAEEPIAQFAWIAAICHNTDRLFPECTEDEIADKVWQYLDTTDFYCSREVKKLVVEAVMSHSGKPSPSDSPLTIVLMDADKLANIGYLLAVRAAQFQPHLPPINLVYLFDYPPGCNYQNPGSICRDVEGALEWEQPGWFRIPKAIKMAEPLFGELRRVKNGILQRYKDTGLLPYPFPEDFEPQK